MPILKLSILHYGLYVIPSLGCVKISIVFRLQYVIGLTHVHTGLVFQIVSDEGDIFSN